MINDRYVEESDMSKVYLVQAIDINGQALYYGPYFNKKMPHRIISSWKSKRNSAIVAMHILSSDVDWEE
jgi:hypothetical protein